jgi:hypothetical protein
MISNIVNLRSARAVKEFIETANEHILILENALYSVMEAKDLTIAKETAAEALDEDLEEYLAEDNLQELDFEDDSQIPWADIKEEE